MRTWMTRSMIAVAALAVAAASASAQTYKAEIPMSFRVGDKQMAPGSYDFQLAIAASGVARLVVHTVDGSAAAMLLPSPGSDTPKAWLREGTPKIAFDCVGRTCSLAQLWNGWDASVYKFPVRKLPPVEAERLSVFTVALTRAD